MDEHKAPTKPPTFADVAKQYQAMTGEPLTGGYEALAYALTGEKPPAAVTLPDSPGHVSGQPVPPDLDLGGLPPAIPKR
jgi:hypothetical protein